MGYSPHQWGCDPFLLGEHILQRSTFNDSWIASQLSIGGYHHSWKFVNGEQSCTDLSVYTTFAVIPTKEKFFQLCSEKTSFGFPFLLSFVLVKVPPPKEHQQPKKSQSSTTFIYVFLGGAYPPPPKKKTTNQTVFVQVRGGKNSTESGRTFGCRRLGLTFEAARAGEDHKCPTCGATVAGGETGVGSLVLLNAGNGPPKKRLGGLWIFGFELFFLFCW